MLLLHGTSADSLQKILTEGFKTSSECIDSNWVCSGDYIYFWKPLSFTDYEDNPGTRWIEAFDNALGSAEFSLPRAKDCRRAVIEVEVDSQYLEEDTSCLGMDNACCVPAGTPIRILRYWLDKDSLDFFRVYFACSRFEVKRDYRMRPLGLTQDALARPLSLTEAEYSLVKSLLGSDSDSFSTVFETLRELRNYMEETVIAKPYKKYTIQFDLEY